MKSTLDLLTTGDIVPGERVGAFALGEAWTDLMPRLPATYQIEQRPNCFVVHFPSFWFFIDQPFEFVSQITVLKGFMGRIDKQFGIGSPLKELVRRYGPWAVDSDITITFTQLPGVCFDLSFPIELGEEINEDELVAYISVYRS